MTGWTDRLRDELAKLETGGLLRLLTPCEPQGRLIHVGGVVLANLGSNDYLGLAQHPRLIDAAVEATRRFGTGATASRLVSGHTHLIERVEQRFAQFKHSEAALLCPTGTMANHAVLTGLAREGDLICADKLSHASLMDAARACGATLRVYPHLNYEKLERLLVRHKDAPQRFIATDSVFSMDGDTADLPALCVLAQRHGAVLIVDEAHATGVLGMTGAGLAEAQGVAQRVDITVSTASKALGGLGGVITARRPVIDTLINRARSFIYTTAVQPAQAAVIEAALDVVKQEPWRRQRLAEISGRVHAALRTTGLKPEHGAVAQPCTPIVPLIVGEPQDALSLSQHLARHGVFAPAIRPPSVAGGSSRVRLSLRADLEVADIDRLCEAVDRWR